MKGLRLVFGSSMQKPDRGRLILRKWHAECTVVLACLSHHNLEGNFWRERSPEDVRNKRAGRFNGPFQHIAGLT